MSLSGQVPVPSDHKTDHKTCIYLDREPLAGIDLARDTIATLYTGYLSVERGSAEVAVPA